MTRQDGIIKIIPGERFTPFSLANKLGAVALLESSSFIRGKERYSLLMIKKAFTLEQRGGEIFYQDETKRTKMAKGLKDILDACEYYAGQHHLLGQDFPFPAGGFGFLSYDFARYCDKIRLLDRPDPLGLPEACFLFGHVFVIFDHYTDLLYVIGLNYSEHEIDLDRAVRETEERIRDMNFNYLQENSRTYSARIEEGNKDKKSFMKSVGKVRDEIIAGNLLQGVLSRRISIRTDLPALEAYRRLRSVNPSPYLFISTSENTNSSGHHPKCTLSSRTAPASSNPLRGPDGGERPPGRTRLWNRNSYRIPRKGRSILCSSISRETTWAGSPLPGR